MTAGQEAATPAPSDPDVVIALVTPMGAPTEQLMTQLEGQFGRFGYTPRPIRLSELLSRLDDGASGAYDGEAERLIDLGDRLCSRLGDNSAVARLGVRELRRLRDEDGADNFSTTGARRAWILRSIKRPEEVTLLRHTYGDSLYVLALNSSYEARLKYIAHQLRLSSPLLTEADAESRATRLIDRDEREADQEYGQNVRDAFPMADVIFPGRNPELLRDSVRRFIELLFGGNLVPTAAEHAMYMAEGAAALSSVLGRKVGASITTPQGEVVAVGANEVPKAGGGLYGALNAQARAQELEGDYSALSLRHLAAKTIDLLREQGWLSEEKGSMDRDELAQEVILLFKAEKSPLMDIIEYMRPVHAEMAALMEAARRGVATLGTILYTTTYPCHLCAKEIVAAGVQSVVYIERYPKSRAQSMYGEEIGATAPGVGVGEVVSFSPFEGVTPSAYRRLFRSDTPQRKDQYGRVVASPEAERRPKVGNAAALVMARDELEDEVIDPVLDPINLRDEGAP